MVNLAPPKMLDATYTERAAMSQYQRCLIYVLHCLESLKLKSKLALKSQLLLSLVRASRKAEPNPLPSCSAVINEEEED